jgi:hypothetical protein
MERGKVPLRQIARLATRVAFIVVLVGGAGRAQAERAGDDVAIALRDNVVRLHAQWQDGAGQD